ncbi:MAG: hypothetical protein AB1758_14630, partial [Candidatus Eremiobacterota bacterium]
FTVHVPAAVREIARDPAEVYVLNLPMSTSTGALHSGVGQLLQGYHGKRMVTGYAAFDNPLYLRRIAESPLSFLDFPAALQGGCDPRAVGQALEQLEIGYVIYEKRTQFYTPWFTLKQDGMLRGITLSTLTALERQGRLDLLEEDDGYAIYRVVQD